jgi:hypothetical protein
MFRDRFGVAEKASVADVTKQLKRSPLSKVA